VSGAPSSKSLMCCGVRPSGPPADPSGKVRTALVTSSLETAKGTNRGLPVGSVNVRLSVGGGGCLSWRAQRVSSFGGAGVSVEQSKRTAALKLHCSSFFDTAEAKTLSDFSLVFLSFLCCPGLEMCGVGASSSLQAATLFVNMVERLRLAPPLSGFAKINGPNWKTFFHAVMSFGFWTILSTCCVSSLEQAARADFGMRSTSLIHGGWERVLGDVVVVYGKLVLGVEELDEGAGVALTPVVDGAMPDPGHGLLLEPCLCSVPSLRWTLKVNQHTGQTPVSLGDLWLMCTQ